MLRIKLDSGTNQISHVSLMRNITGSPNDALSSKGEHRFKNHTRCCRSQLQRCTQNMAHESQTAM